MDLSNKVSVVIPTFNRCENVVNLIRSISESSYSNIEIIVVDNNSTDNTGNRIRKLIDTKETPFSLKYIFANSNLNASGGRYLGAKYAIGDYILFIDDDNIIMPNMIEALVSFANKHSDVGLIAPCALVSDKQDYIQNLGAWVDLKTSRAIFRQPSPIRIKDIDKNAKYDTLSALNSFMVSRKAYESSGGWDPNFGIMFDESDLGMRIKNAGYRAFFATDARCIHLGARFEEEQNELRSLGMGTPARAFFFARNRSIFMRRYAPWYGLISYLLIFYHLFTCYYVYKALKHKRFDIAKKYLAGAYWGLICPKKMKIGFVQEVIVDDTYV